MPNPKRIEEIRHYYVGQNVSPTNIARILLRRKKGSVPTLASMTSLVNWYINRYEMVRKGIMPFRKRRRIVLANRRR